MITLHRITGDISPTLPPVALGASLVNPEWIRAVFGNGVQIPDLIRVSQLEFEGWRGIQIDGDQVLMSRTKDGFREEAYLIDLVTLNS